MKIVKKVLLMALSFVLVAAISVGATLAFLADTDSDVNVMTVGNVKIDQVEYERADVSATGTVTLRDFTQAKPLDPAVYAGGYTWATDDEITGTVPGGAVVTMNVWKDIENEQDKFVFVKNTGVNKAYLRTWFAFELGDLSLDDWSKMFHINKNTTNWDWTTVGTAEIDNVQHAVVYATYKTALAPGALAAPSLLQYAMDEDATNETVASFKGSYDILVFSQAVQTTGFDSADQALLKAFTLKTPWGDAVIDSKPATGSLKDAIAGPTNEPTVQLNLSGNISWTTGAGIGSTPVLDENSTVESLYLMGTSPADTKLIVDGSGVGALRAANGGKLVFSNMTIVDKSASYAENSWEYGYLEFGGNLVFVNCVFEGAIMLEGNDTNATNATFLNCTFKSLKDSEYAVWVAAGTVTFDNCTFAPYRGLKIHEAYGSEVSKVVVENCTFGPLTKKPGIAIGTLNEDTSVTVVNNIFNGCQAGDQGLYIYETDTDVTTFAFVLSNNVIPVSGQAEKLLDDLLGKGSDVVLENDLSFSSKETANTSYGAAGVTVKGGVLDGNGNTIHVTNANATWDCAVATTGGTIKNVTVAGAMRGIFTGGIDTDLYIENVVFDDVIYTFNSDGTTGSCADYGVYISNSTLNGWTSFSNMFKEVIFTNCSFGEGSGYAFCRPYQAVTFKDCAFESGYTLDIARTTGIVLDNCTIGGVLVTADNIQDLIGGADDAHLVPTNVIIK